MYGTIYIICNHNNPRKSSYQLKQHGRRTWDELVRKVRGEIGMIPFQFLKLYKNHHHF